MADLIPFSISGVICFFSIISWKVIWWKQYCISCDKASQCFSFLHRGPAVENYISGPPAFSGTKRVAVEPLMKIDQTSFGTGRFSLSTSPRVSLKCFNQSASNRRISLVATSISRDAIFVISGASWNFEHFGMKWIVCLPEESRYFPPILAWNLRPHNIKMCSCQKGSTGKYWLHLTSIFLLRKYYSLAYSGDFCRCFKTSNSLHFSDSQYSCSQPPCPGSRECQPKEIRWSLLWS